jgi:catalase
MKAALERAGAQGLVVAGKLGVLKGAGGQIEVDHTSLTMPSVVFDALYVPGGAAAATTLAGSGLILSYIAEAYKHLKALAFGEEAAALIEKAGIELDSLDAGVLIGDAAAIAEAFIEAIGRHRVWSRKNLEPVPA